MSYAFFESNDASFVFGLAKTCWKNLQKYYFFKTLYTRFTLFNAQAQDLCWGNLVHILSIVNIITLAQLSSSSMQGSSRHPHAYAKIPKYFPLSLEKTTSWYYGKRICLRKKKDFFITKKVYNFLRFWMLFSAALQFLEKSLQISLLKSH